MTNTLLVMNGIYIFFGQSYAAASNKAVEHIYDVILGIILGFGIPEAIVAGILTTARSRSSPYSHTPGSRPITSIPANTRSPFFMIKFKITIPAAA